jgi:7-keto-8-aminopelargonate synthetase-like enzyme
MEMTVASPMAKLEDALRQNTLVRIIERFGAEHSAATHLKDLVIDEAGPGREIVVLGRRVVNFGSDSFLGLDRDPRVREAIRRGLARWGTHNGSSRAFMSVRANIDAERALADWLGVESVLIHPSVMLANLGAIPGLTGRQDAIALDEQAHSSMQDAAKIARANGTKVAAFAHSDPAALERTLQALRPYRSALVCIDGVYSMSGKIPPMIELNRVARAADAVLYIDDAHGTGVLGEQGRGTVLEALGSYDNTFVVGSLSKAFSLAGGFIACPEPFQRLLKIRSSPYVFGGPVVPCFLEAIETVIDILHSEEYTRLRAGLDAAIGRLTRGLTELGLFVMGGATPIVSIAIGDEADTLEAGKFLFDRGYYVQSVLFPAVPYHAGVLRVQCNANHDESSIDGLIDAFAALSAAMVLPGPPEPPLATIPPNGPGAIAEKLTSQRKG